MPKIELNSDRSFLINDIPYQKGVYELIISPMDRAATEGFVKITRNGADETAVAQGALEDWTDAADSNFATIGDFLDYVEPFFFRSISGGGGSGVTSVNGDTGPAVILTGGNIPNDSSVSGATVSDALETLASSSGDSTLNRVYFTGDEETLAAGTFYKTNRDNEGTVATVNEQISVAGDSSAFFTQDLIGDPYVDETSIPKGNYTGVLSVGASNSLGVKFSFDAELYLCDNDGNPVASGIAGQPVGDLGVQVISIASTGEISIGITVTEIQSILTAVLPSELVIPAGFRIRYHIQGSKVGANIGNSTLTVYYGTDHAGYVDLIPSQITSDGVESKAELGNNTVTEDINQLAEAGEEVFPISALEGVSNFNIGQFFGVLKYFRAGVFNTIRVYTRNLNLSPTQSFQFRAALYSDDLTTQLGQGVKTLTDTQDNVHDVFLGSDIVLDSDYYNIVVGLNDNIGGGSVTGIRATANALNSEILSFNVTVGSGVLPPDLSVLTRNSTNTIFYSLIYKA